MFFALICVGAVVLTGAAWGDASTDGRFRAEVAVLIQGIPPGAKILLAADATRYLRTGPYGRSDELFRFDGRQVRPPSPAAKSGRQVRPLNTMGRADHGR